MRTEGDAVVLGTSALGEADLVVVLFTREWGKLRTIARGARRSRRRFPGGLAVGQSGRVVLHRAREVHRLEDFNPSGVSHLSFGRDLRRYAYVGYACELTAHLMGDADPAPRLFEALCLTLERLASQAPTAWELRRYELAVLDAMGALPRLDACCACGAEFDDALENIAFDARRGGLLCSSHAGAAPMIPLATVRVAALLFGAGRAGAIVDPERGARSVGLSAGLADVGRQLPTPIGEDSTIALRRGLRDLVWSMLREHLRAPLRSLEFLRELGREPGVHRDRREPW